MAQLIIRNEASYLIQKKITTVGSDPAHDLMIKCQPHGLAFTISKEHTADGVRYEIFPGRIKLRLNGLLLNRKSELKSCDRLEWDEGIAVFVDSLSPLNQHERSASDALESLNVLQNLAATLQRRDGQMEAALNQTLDALVDIANAEEGYLLSEWGHESSSWKLVASHKADDSSPYQSRKELFSNTILTEAINKQSPVYIENMIGHAYAAAASVIEARLFSVACFPLAIDGRVFGAVFLFTRSPGRSIRKERLAELGVLATQAALMMASSVELRQIKQENKHLRALISSSPFVYDRTPGASPMTDIERKIAKLAPTPLPILIRGETGTGKELTAREIHRLSGRAAGPFVAINCAAIPSTLLEATLFGYEKGAYTGAVKSQQGKFLQANKGTLFLDEIGDLPGELQAKLLRVLQEKMVEPLGALKGFPIDVRIVTATHQPLESLVKEGRFRQDLFFRIAGTTIELPPLRRRKKDIVVLAQNFLNKQNLESGTQKTLSPETLEFIENYVWPGNVRELEQVITKAALLSEENIIAPHELELSHNLETPREEFQDSVEDFESLDEAQMAFTHKYVSACLNRHNGNRADTARKLGISERTLYRILAHNSSESGGRSP